MGAADEVAVAEVGEGQSGLRAGIEELSAGF